MGAEFDGVEGGVVAAMVWPVVGVDSDVGADELVGVGVGDVSVVAECRSSSRGSALAAKAGNSMATAPSARIVTVRVLRKLRVRDETDSCASSTARAAARKDSRSSAVICGMSLGLLLVSLSGFFLGFSARLRRACSGVRSGCR